MRRVPSVSSEQQCELLDFALVSSAAGQFDGPDALNWDGARAVQAPATVGAALARQNKLELGAPPDLDGSDHWFRTQLPGRLPSGSLALAFDGLATLADVWLDGEHILTSDSMFHAHELDVTERARPGSVLVLRFRALSAELAKRRPRPRWRTRIVDTQQLRWIRTSLIGRTPGFCPRVPVIGPYRPIRLLARSELQVQGSELTVRTAGQSGVVAVSLTVRALTDAPLPSTAELIVEGAAGSGCVPLTLTPDGDQLRLRGELTIARACRWWPHTHGEQPLSRAAVQLGDHTIELGRIGFRELTVDRDDDERGFGIVINGVPVFCRGACWTTNDLLRPGVDDARETLLLARAAGMNMLRIGGTTSYESAAFYDACDELGILVFQDFMFANMDYPSSDDAFAASVEREARELLSAIGARPCLTVLCGGSEVEQQVAMLGMARELWTNPLFSELLPRISSEHAPGVPYVSSSPTGGELPFQVDTGISHYYGVGAYHRPLEDARRANVRFAAECLAFANPPCRDTIDSFMRDLEMPFHHPRWKERVPRDRGAGWDFEDTRDHYVQRLFGEDPRELRYQDPERYLNLGMAAVGETITATYSEFRRENGSCRGALVFWLKDFWDGAGWGVIDASGRPKSAYYYLKRALAPITVLATDEGLNGVLLHVVNDSGNDVSASLEVDLFRAGDIHLATGRADLTVAAHSTVTKRVEALLERFSDSAYAYRFGPSNHDLVAATLRRGDLMMAQCFHQPTGRARAIELDLGLRAHAETHEGQPFVRVATHRFAQAVTLDVPGFRPADDWFHLAPHSERLIALERLADGSSARVPQPSVRGAVAALNTYARPTIVSEAR